MVICKVEKSNLEDIIILLESLFDDSEEISDRMKTITHLIDNFFIATHGDATVGIIGYQLPCKELKKYSHENQTIEIISLFVRNDYRGKGVGKLLVAEIEDEAKKQGYRELLIWSGPRFRETGWGFYDNLPGFIRVGFVESKEFPVWKKTK